VTDNQEYSVKVLEQAVSFLNNHLPYIACRDHGEPDWRAVAGGEDIPLHLKERLIGALTNAAVMVEEAFERAKRLPID
jgi:hypothetical protein